MLADPKLGCHRTGFVKKCRRLVSDGQCNRWIMIEGNDPISGAPMQRWDCVDNWPIALLIDIAKKIANGSGGVQASVESFRNEMVMAQNAYDPDRLLNKPV